MLAELDNFVPQSRSVAVYPTEPQVHPSLFPLRMRPPRRPTSVMSMVAKAAFGALEALQIWVDLDMLCTVGLFMVLSCEV